MRFQIRRAWMSHEGGTKFYNPILISAPGPKHCTVINFGKVTGLNVSSRAVQGGQIQIKGGNKQRELVDAKKGRGYALARGGDEVKEYQTFNAFKEGLVREFGASRADDICIHLGYTVTGAEAPSDDTHHADVPGTKPAIVERPESWGAWGA